jgi:hypothetical protein
MNSRVSLIAHANANDLAYLFAFMKIQITESVLIPFSITHASCSFASFWSMGVSWMSQSRKERACAGVRATNSPSQIHIFLVSSRSLTQTCGRCPLSSLPSCFGLSAHVQKVNHDTSDRNGLWTSSRCTSNFTPPQIVQTSIRLAAICIVSCSLILPLPFPHHFLLFPSVNNSNCPACICASRCLR